MSLSELEAMANLTPEERAQRDADWMNKERGKENEVDGYECEACLNRGYIYFANGVNTSCRECDCWQARRTIRRMMRSGLGPVIKKYTFGKYKADEEWQKLIKSKAEAFAHDPSGWFFIGGASGAGKSHICTAICRSLLAKHPVHYMMWEEEGFQLKGLTKDSPAEYQKRMDRLKTVDVLYIDDFFSGRRERDGKRSMPSDADIRMAREILNARYVANKITIISSEWHSMEISELDNAIGGRIVEMGREYCINVGRTPDKNMRLRMGGEIL